MLRSLCLIVLAVFQIFFAGCDRSNQTVREAMKAGKPFVLTFDTTNTLLLRSDIYVLDSSNRKLTHFIDSSEQWSQSIEQLFVDHFRESICDSDFFQLPSRNGGIVADGGFLKVKLTCGGATIEKNFYSTTKADTNFPYVDLRSKFEAFAVQLGSESEVDISIQANRPYSIRGTNTQKQSKVVRVF